MSIQNRIKSLEKLLQDGRPRSVLELRCINRQIDDLKHGHKRGLVWDEFEAQRAVKFFSLLKHWKGEWANKPMSLEPWQEHCVIAPMFGWYLGNDRKNGGFRRFRTVYIEVPRKNGKALSVDTKIPTADGWKRMGDIEIGDIVFDENGNQCSVDFMSDVMFGHECYQVSFSDGTSIVADEEHLWWTIARSRTGGIKGKRGGRKSAIRTTREIMETLICGNRPTHKERNHSIPVSGPVCCDEKEFSIDPYVFGCWIGDGHSSCSTITCHDNDHQIIENIRRCGVPVKQRAISDGSCSEFSLSTGTRTYKDRVASVQTELRKLGVINNKHIPVDYLRGSFSQRLSLLQGLMDTDGCCSKAGSCEFTTTRLNVANDAAELIRSLGIKVAVKSGLAKLNGKVCGPKYRLIFYPGDLIVFRLDRKTARQRAVVAKNRRSATLQIIAVEKVPSVPVKCISVTSPSHLYLAGEGFTATHNTTLSAGIGLQGLVADYEPGAEVYAAATARDQALILFKDAKNVLGDIREFVNPMAQAIECKELGSTFKPLSSDYNSLDGLNVHRAIIDELHAHKTRDLWDVIMTAQGARRHPMTVAITTAGVDRQSICWELREYSRAVLEGQPEHDDSFFAFIACADENDDWQDENTWRKANPNYGVSVKPEYLKTMAKQAKASGAAENNFRRKHLNQWVASEARWIDAGAWVACKDDDFPTLENAECFGAVDLGWRDDLAAFAKVFPDREKIEVDDNEEQPDHGPLYKINNAWVQVKFWMPADGKRDITKAPWTNWIQQGLITVTDGNTTDIDEIYHEVVNASKVYNLRRVCLDPNNARQFGQELMKAGIPVKEFWQNRRNYTEPMLDFETAISEGRLHHDGNDLLRWQIGNVQVEVDSQGYCMPSKGKSKDKIDGPVSLLMAWAESMYADLETEWVYEKRGILFL